MSYLPERAVSSRAAALVATSSRVKVFVEPSSLRPWRRIDSEWSTKRATLRETLRVRSCTQMTCASIQRSASTARMRKTRQATERRGRCPSPARELSM